MSNNNYYRSFNPGQPCDYCHTHKTRQIYYQPEPNFWMVMVSIYAIEIAIILLDANMYNKQ